MEAKLLLAFGAGLVSFATPCVLPLVPGYLSAVSGAAPGVTGRKVVAASLPFVLGFTVVFVALGALAGGAGGLLDDYRSIVPQVAGLVIVVLGLSFMGLLPFPYLDRLAAPDLMQGAQRRGSAALLGAAFAVCAAPCVGVLLGAILALAADSRTVVRGCILLAAYSFGITVAFVLIGIAFTRAMAAFRWVRDHYDWIRYLSGGTLVVLGLLLFFNRDWWLRVLLNRALDALGLGGQL